MIRRRLTLTLHWATLLLLVCLMAGGPLPWLAWSFGLVGLSMTGIACVAGLMSGPGPKLLGALRVFHPWAHRALYAFLAYVSGATLAQQLGYLPNADLPVLYFYLFSASTLHAIFHLWRHTSLNDGALRRMTPRILHDMI